jgi:hypothetical protein
MQINMADMSDQINSFPLFHTTSQIHVIERTKPDRRIECSPTAFFPRWAELGGG